MTRHNPQMTLDAWDDGQAALGDDFGAATADTTPTPEFAPLDGETAELVHQMEAEARDAAIAAAEARDAAEEGGA